MNTQTTSALSTLIFALVVLLEAGCTARVGVRTLVPKEEYVVYYKWEEVEKEFGRDKTIAIPLLLDTKGLVPSECTLGIEVIRGGETENGGGWTLFRCKPNQ